MKAATLTRASSNLAYSVMSSQGEPSWPKQRHRLRYRDLNLFLVGVLVFFSRTTPSPSTPSQPVATTE
jgi:hypothetical protein